MTSQDDCEPQSLKNLLLEYAVYKFHEIFLEKDGNCVKKNIFLPCGLFESVLDKSKEICWIIPFDHLKLCLAARDALRWENIDLTYRHDRGAYLFEKDLQIIASSSTNVRSLRFFTQRLPSQSLRHLAKMRGLEILEIRCNPHRDAHAYKKCSKKFKLRKLKKLIIDCNAIEDNFLYCLELKDCSLSLDTLIIKEISGYYLEYIPILQSISSFRNLRHFALCHLSDGPRCFTDEMLRCCTDNIKSIMRDLRKIKHLKSLDFSCWKLPRYNHRLRELINNVKSIENVEVNKSSFSDDVWSIRRRLKFLGIYRQHQSSEKHLPSINADKIAGDFNLETLVTCLEVFIGDETLLNFALRSLSNRLERNNYDITEDIFQRIATVSVEIVYKYITSSTQVLRNTFEILSDLEEKHKLDPKSLKKMYVAITSALLCDEKTFRKVYRLHKGYLKEYFETTTIEASPYIEKSLLDCIWIDNGDDDDDAHEERIAELRSEYMYVSESDSFGYFADEGDSDDSEEYDYYSDASFDDKR